MVIRIESIQFITVANLMECSTMNGEGVGEHEVGSVPGLKARSVGLHPVAMVRHGERSTVEGCVDEAVSAKLDHVGPG